uniref:Protein crumbs homolog 1-like n=1 Tax=Takifugu rubripes TaxID=31033 RepID=A0A674MXW7_TAKRU
MPVFEACNCVMLALVPLFPGKPCLCRLGNICSDLISGCEQQPCQNGGVCESHGEGFTCLCSQQSRNGRLYGGATCATVLTGCDGNRCENGGICAPLFINNQHAHACSCLAGFAGPNCETTTVFSFESRGYMYVETQPRGPEAPVNVTFDFRSEGPVGTLVQHRVDDLVLSIELCDGHLCLRSLRGQGSGTLVQQLPEFLSDSRWHRVEASLGGVFSFIRLICTGQNCTGFSGAEVQLRRPPNVVPEPGAARQSLFIGGGRRGWDGAESPPGFLGCFRDVLVDSHLVVPGVASEGSDVQANVTVGCSDRDKCEESPCQNRGRCVSQGWRSYLCECIRPHEGHDCGEEYITARFGNKSLESYALFSLDDDPGDAATVSMFIRTRQPSGLLLILANSTSQYLRLWLEEGRVKVQVNTFETFVGRGLVSDGHFHLVSLRLDATEAVLFQAAQNQGSLQIRPIQAQSGDQVFVGGLPDSRATAVFGGYFKGCFQDLRINSKRLQFFPMAAPVDSHRLERLSSVARGCSGDDACAVNPCLNGGVCYSMWDDFVCNCPPNTAGQRCEEVKWCELSPCPDTAACQLRSRGFECLSNVTFRVGSSVLSYRSNGRIHRRLHSVSLSFRTRQPNATLLHARKDSDHLTVSLLDSRLLVELQAGTDQVTLRSRTLLSDGRWHRVELRLENQIPPTSCWVMAADGDEEERNSSGSSVGALEFLKGGADVFLGGMSLDAGAAFSGCLGPVEIGGLPLPFHHDTELKLPRPQEELFTMLHSNAAPRHGCWGASVCAPGPCENNAACEDLFDLHRCRCTPGWTGPLCQESTDHCVSGPCVHGNCTNRPGRFECACEPGHRGERCEVEVDVCEDSKCVNGATCLKGFQSYSCLCPQNLTGQYCRWVEKVPDIPWYIEINPLPRLPASPCRGARWNYSCFNGGNCSDLDGCDCRPGFTGHWCEKDVDECASDPCMNGGFCLNYVNSFECACDLNHSGIHCQMDVSDFYLYVFLSLWQNLFQLMSYLMIRLDDEPEIDLGFQLD